MQTIIGTDEAGYGPNLGPLVITATVWEVPDGVTDLYACLADAICSVVEEGEQRLPITDSKLLYKSGSSLAALEKSVLAMLDLADRRPDSWREAWSQLDASTAETLGNVPWYVDYDEPLPIDCEAVDWSSVRSGLSAAFSQAGVRLLRVKSRIVLAQRFNQLLDQHTNKSNSLSAVTLELVREMSSAVPAGKIRVCCDKHGGRSHYAALLQHIFPEHFIEVFEESRRCSYYRFGPQDRRFEVSFTAGGESELATALASMVSKYLRELAMRAFNRFWQARIERLKPTAGYPVDAKRFKREIRPKQQELGIRDETLWRAR